MSRIWFWVKRCLNAVALLVSVSLLVLTLSWWLTDDEPLHPDILALLAPVPETGDINGFYIQVGLNAPEGQDAHEAGRMAVAAVNKALADPKAPVIASFSQFFVGEEIKPLFALGRCRSESEPCVDAYRANAEKYAAIRALPSFTTLNARYQQFLAAPTFANTMVGSLRAPQPFSATLPTLSEVGNAQHALRLGVAPPSVENVGAFADEFLRWRHVLKTSDSLVVTMMAANVLDRKINLLNSLLDRSPALSMNPAIASALVPLTPDERTLARAMRSELRFIASITLEFPIMGDRLQSDDKFFMDRAFGRIMANGYKPHATTNRQYEQMVVRQAAFGSSAKLAMLKSIEAAQVKEPSLTSVFLTSPFTNPVGEIMAQMAVPAYANYYLRLYDLDAYTRVTAARVRLLAENVPVDKVAAKLAEWAPTLSDPYTEAAFAYDVSAKKIFATRKSQDSEKPPTRFELSYP